MSRQTKIAALQSRIADLTAELEALQAQEDAPTLPEGSERHEWGSWTLQLEMIRCGKPKCKCARGDLHGPYWYGYRSQGGKTKSCYIGKDLEKWKAKQTAEP